MLKLINMVCCFFLLFRVVAQPDLNWVTEVSKDESISVSYAIHEHINDSGDKIQMLEYKVIATANSSVESCVAVMKDDANHYLFMDNTTVSKRIKDISATEWLTYYFIDTPWPVPNSDCITRYTILDEKDSLMVKVLAIAEPDAYPEKDVKRMQYNYSEYTFSDIGNGKVQIIIYSRTSPVVSAPNWMLKSWFPEGPANMMRGIIQLAQKQE